MNASTFKQKRVSRLMTQRELSIESGVDEPVIDSFEKGLIKPDKEVLTKLLYALYSYKPTLG